jgi:predicted Zn finger-like uncharacterized protein
MIITCASCLTKFNLDDSRIPAKGIKVRCSRCKHVFYVVPPPETKEEAIEGFESFAKYHEELMEPGQKEVERPALEKVKVEEEEKAPEEEAFLFAEKPPLQKVEEVVPVKPMEEERAEVEPVKPKKMVRKEKRGSSLFFILIFVLILLVLSVFYIWSEIGTGGKLPASLESPVKKIIDLWGQIWGTEKENLIVGNLNGYEEKIGEMSLFVIEGKVNNQSRFTKKHIKIKVVIFDREKAKVAEKETVCGRIIGRGELKNLPADFFQGEMVVKPQTEEEKVVPSGKAAPFMIIFKDISPEATEFKVEIVEAPNL